MTDKIPMDHDDKIAAEVLAKCTFLPGSWNKLFAYSMADIAKSDEPLLTKKQRNNLWRLVYMHRKQIYGPGKKWLIDKAKPYYDAAKSAREAASSNEDCT